MPRNILFLMTDQHRPDYVGYHPQSRVALPNIDRLAEGTAFMNCQSVNPICTPARTALLTGKYTHQIGTLQMSGDLSVQHPTYARALQRAGYWTAGIGKFHWMQGWPWPTGRGQGHDLVALEEQTRLFGFDHVWEAEGKQLAVKNYGHYCKHLDEKGILEAYRDHVKSRGGNYPDAARVEFTGEPWPFDEADYVDVVTGDRVIDAIRNRPSGRPFMIFGSFCSPHAPFDPPQRFLDAVEPDEEDNFVGEGADMPPELKRHWYRLRRSYKAMLRCVDEQVGRILAELEDQGLLGDTLVLFTTDHGEMMGDHGLQQKASPYWQACNVPAIVRHPDYLTGGRVTSPVELTDLTATMLDVAGLDTSALTKGWPAFHDNVPARSLMPIIRGEREGVRRFAFSECRAGWQMVTDERWKYVRWLNRPEDEPPFEQLFDRSADPDELNNLANEPGAAAALTACRAHREWVMDTTHPAQLRWAPTGENPTPWLPD